MRILVFDTEYERSSRMGKRKDEPQSLIQAAQKAIPQGLTPEAQLEREHFLARYKIAAQQIDSIALSILIWGPNPQSDTPIAQKRKEILECLISDGHNAMFSEHLPAFAKGLPLNAQEFAQ